MKNTESKLKRNNKGITLVALVVTIIVLLILATITISAIFGENGIINKAKIAKELTKNAIKEEENFMESIDKYLTLAEANPNYFTYEFNEDNKTATITGVKVEFGNTGNNRFISIIDGDKEITDIILPETVEKSGVTYTVTAIGNNAFYNKAYDGKCTSFIIPDTVISIGNSAFEGHRNLLNIDIPSSVVSIGNRAFAWTGIKDIIIPENVTSIGEYAFYYSELKSATLPASDITIGNKAFMNCSLETVIIPEGIISLGDGTFYGCSSLNNVVIPKSVNSIGKQVFSECSSLTNITLPETITSIGDSAFSKTGLKSITIPNNVQTIG